jgi:hypothetical protein
MIVIIILLAPRVQYPVDRDQWISYSLCNNVITQPLLASYYNNQYSYYYYFFIIIIIAIKLLNYDDYGFSLLFFNSS